MPDYQKLGTIYFEGELLNVNYKETVVFRPGVTCHTYEFEGDHTRDLAIIEVEPGCKTPLQKVIKGEKTVEGYLSGKGKLTVVDRSGQQNVRTSENLGNFYVGVTIGELMQWEATPDSKLVFYELCYPPYKDDRFENIE
jgi:hypothetical protein